LESLGIILKKAREESGLTQTEIAEKMGKSKRTIQYWEQGRSEPDTLALKELMKLLRFSLPDKSANIAPSDENAGQPEPYYKKRLKQKIAENPERDGIIFVPINAQAGYTRYYVDPVFINQLERIYMPGFPYKGNRYRIFEVDGSSMEPTFKEGYFVVCERVEKEMWHTIPDYYAYVVITSEQVLLKRIFKKSDTVFIMISDNEEFYNQFTLKISDIREIWQVKRKMDWEMAPPKRFEINI